MVLYKLAPAVIIQIPEYIVIEILIVKIVRAILVAIPGKRKNNNMCYCIRIRFFHFLFYGKISGFQFQRLLKFIITFPGTLFIVLIQQFQTSFKTGIAGFFFIGSYIGRIICWLYNRINRRRSPDSFI